MIAKLEIIYWVSLLAPNDGAPVINNWASLPDKTASLLLDNEIFCPNQGHLHSSRAEVSWVTNYRTRWSWDPHYWLMNGDGCLQVRTFLCRSHAIVQVAGNEPFHHPHSLTTAMSDSQHFKHLMRFQRNVEKIYPIIIYLMLIIINDDVSFGLWGLNRYLTNRAAYIFVLLQDCSALCSPIFCPGFMIIILSIYIYNALSHNLQLARTGTTPGPFCYRSPSPSPSTSPDTDADVWQVAGVKLDS